jgi:hypothetical protein
MKIITLCLAQIAAVGALATATAEQPIDLKLNAAVLSAPASVLVTATVVPDERNRSLVVSAESVEFLRSSTIELAGEHEARVHQLWLKGLPEGAYIVTAEVRDGDDVRAVASAKLEVVGMTVDR